MHSTASSLSAAAANPNLPVESGRGSGAAMEDLFEDRVFAAASAAPVVYEENPLHALMSAKMSSRAQQGAGSSALPHSDSSAGVDVYASSAAAGAEHSFLPGEEEEYNEEGSRSLRRRARAGNRRVSFVRTLEYFEERGIGAPVQTIFSLGTALGEGRKVTLARSVVLQTRSAGGPGL